MAGGDGIAVSGATDAARAAASIVLWPATALITGNVSVTVEVVRLVGPTFGGMALVGFDDFPLADVIGAGLTVVAQGTEAIGRAAVDLLRARKDDPARAVQTVTVPTELIVRGSG
jgi:LacI family transcriptional regulator, galactose operon repressor